MDTETGGLSNDCSLLTAYFLVLDSNLNKIDDLHLSIKESNGIYKVTSNALKVNNINLIEHEQHSISKELATTTLREFLKTYNRTNKLIPIGHNVTFDLEKITHHLIPKDELNQYLCYRVIDTAIIGRFLILSNLLPNIKGSLGSFSEYFKTTKYTLHSADGDVKTCIDVLKEMVKLVK